TFRITPLVDPCKLDNGFAVRAMLQRLGICCPPWGFKGRAVTPCFRFNAVLFLRYSKDTTRDLMQWPYQKCRKTSSTRAAMCRRANAGRMPGVNGGLSPIGARKLRTRPLLPQPPLHTAEPRTVASPSSCV